MWNNYKNELESFGRETVDIITNDINFQGLIRTGKLLGSIEYRVFETSDLPDIEFYMVEYGKYVDEGTKYITARKFFNQNIESQFQKWETTLASAIAKDYLDEITS